jgi:hypothetical protein
MRDRSGVDTPRTRCTSQRPGTDGAPDLGERRHAASRTARERRAGSRSAQPGRAMSQTTLPEGLELRLHPKQLSETAPKRYGPGDTVPEGVSIGGTPRIPTITRTPHPPRTPRTARGENHTGANQPRENGDGESDTTHRASSAASEDPGHPRRPERGKAQDATATGPGLIQGTSTNREGNRAGYERCNRNAPNTEPHTTQLPQNGARVQTRRRNSISDTTDTADTAGPSARIRRGTRPEPFPAYHDEISSKTPTPSGPAAAHVPAGSPQPKKTRPYGNQSARIRV